MADGANPQIKIGVGLTAQTSAGADQSIADVERARAAVTAARESEAVAAQESVAASEASAEALSAEAQIAQEYSVSLETAAATVKLLADSNQTFVIGSAEMEAALESVQRQAASTSAELLTAGEVAQDYGVSWDIAAQALERAAQSGATLTLGCVELETALDEVQAASARASATQVAYNEQLRVTASEAVLAAEAEETRAAISETLSAALARLGITQDEVSASAIKLSVSEEIAGRAMVQLAKARLAEQVEQATAALEALNVATVAEGESAEAAAAANEVDADALAKRAIMARRTSDGLVDIALGGRRAVQGVADLQFVLTGLFPEGAATIGVIAGIALIGEVWESMSRKMEREHHEAVGKIRQENGSLADSVEPYKKSLERILLLQQSILDADNQLLANAREKASLAKTDETQDKERQLQSLRNNYLIAQAGAQTDVERKQAKSRYDAAKQDIEDGSTVNTTLLEAAEKQQQIEISQKKLDDLQKQNDADTLAAAESHNRALEAKRLLDSMGVTVSKDGEKGQKLSRIDKHGNSVDAIQEQSDIADNAEQQIRTIGVLNPNSDDPDRNRVIEHFRKIARDARLQRQALLDAAKDVAIDDTQAPIFNRTLNTRATDISKLQDEIENLKDQFKQSQTAVDLAQGKKDQNSQQTAIDQGREFTEQDKELQRSKRDRPLRDKQLSIEDQLDNPSLPKDKRTQLENDEKGIQSQLRRNREADDKVDHPNTDAADQSEVNSANNALSLAMRDVNESGGLGSDAGTKIGQFTELKGHIQDAIAAHKDISGFVIELIGMMQQWKAGSEADRDKILNALGSLRSNHQS